MIPGAGKKCPRHVKDGGPRTTAGQTRLPNTLDVPLMFAPLLTRSPSPPTASTPGRPQAQTNAHTHTHKHTLTHGHTHAQTCTHARTHKVVAAT